MRLKRLRTRNMCFSFNYLLFSLRHTSLACLLILSIKKNALKMYLKNHSCPTKPWLLQIQCLSTGVERGVGQLSSAWCLIHGMKSMFSPISVYVIWLASLGSTVTASTSARPRRWDVRVPVCLTGKPEAAVNQCYRAAWGCVWWEGLVLT